MVAPTSLLKKCQSKDPRDNGKWGNVFEDPQK